MKRYGDNLPFSGICEDELSYQHGRNVSVMYGGCGVNYGSFSKPMEYSRKRKSFSILSLFRSKRNKAQNENK